MMELTCSSKLVSIMISLSN